jgi:hypothetical protein
LQSTETTLFFGVILKKKTDNIHFPIYIGKIQHNNIVN